MGLELDRAGPRPVVFLGPSLPLAEARALLDAEFRPPIRRGDLGAIGPDRPVVILDGEFDQSFSVAPSEIFATLDAGGSVVGAASMGALRAAELADPRMIGLGAIYEAYRSGRIEGDDEVALAYCPFSFGPLTVPLVSLRFWLDALEAHGLIAPAGRAALLRRARRIFYADRTPDRLASFLEAALGAGRLDEIRRAGLGEIPDAKAADVRLALSAIARGRGGA